MDSAALPAMPPLFTHARLVEICAARGQSRRATDTLLAGELAAGRWLRVRRGLYATVPAGLDPADAAIDPYLLATALTPDAVVAYHGALQLHGKAHTLWRRYHCLTSRHARGLVFRDIEIVPVRASRAARALPALGGGVVERQRGGGYLRVTTLERTLVDVLDEPTKSGGWAEIWPSLGSIERLELDAVIAHALGLGTALTVARVGFYLEQHREPLGVDDRMLVALRERAPAQPRYLDSSREHGRFISAWNLVVPERLLTRPSWPPVRPASRVPPQRPELPLPAAPRARSGSPAFRPMPKAPRQRRDSGWRCW